MVVQFGIVVTWDLTAAQQTEVVWQLAGQHTAQRIPEADIEVDELDVEYGPTTHTTIKDDTLTMSKRLYGARNRVVLFFPGFACVWHAGE